MLCRSQPLQGHVRAIAIAFMCLTGIVLFCLVLKVAKSNRHDPLAHFTGTGRNDVIGGIVLLSIKLATCGVLHLATENRKVLYLYPFIVWHCLETVGCIAGIFYCGYITFGGSDVEPWKISVVALVLLCVAILNVWIVTTVISFYKEISKESVQTQDGYPIDVEFHTKGFGDIPSRPNRIEERNVQCYNEYGHQTMAQIEGRQLHQQRDRPVPSSSKGYEDLYRQQDQFNNIRGSPLLN